MDALYMLKSFIIAELKYRTAKRTLLQKRESVYSNIFSQVDFTNVGLGRRSSSVESAVIRLDESEKDFKETIKPLKVKRQKLKESLAILSNRECKAFFALVFHEKVDLSEIEVKALEKEVLSKLCDHIEINYVERCIS